MTANRNPSEVDLKQILNQLKREIFLELNCHSIGEIVSFDSVKQLARVKISYLKTRMIRNDQGVYVEEHYEYPILLDCPTVIYSGGSSGLTMPITAGDFCLILFNDRDIDNWANGNADTFLATSRAHSMSDPIVIVGLRNAKTKIANYDNENPHMFNGDMSFKVKADKFLLSDGSNSLGVLLRALVDAVKAIQTTDSATLSPTSLTAIENAMLAIEGILE